MKLLIFLSEVSIPLILFYIVGFGVLMKCHVYEEFVKGAKDGLKTVVKILPTLIGLMVAVGVLRASGFLDGISGGAGTPDYCKNVFFQRGYRSGTGYFPGVWNRLPCRIDSFYYDVLYRNYFLYYFRVFYCCKGK